MVGMAGEQLHVIACVCMCVGGHVCVHMCMQWDPYELKCAGIFGSNNEEEGRP